MKNRTCSYVSLERSVAAGISPAAIANCTTSAGCAVPAWGQKRPGFPLQISGMVPGPVLWRLHRRKFR